VKKIQMNSKVLTFVVFAVASFAWGVLTLADEVQMPDGSTQQSDSFQKVESTPTPPGWEKLYSELAAVAPQLPPYIIEKRSPVAWENSNHPERELWSKYAYTVINQYFSELDQADDMGHFCKNYKKLDHDQKVMAWAQIFAGISKWETGWDPANRTVEGPDTDEVTGQKPVSEGLLQLSYSDMDNYQDLETSESYCPFTWDKDKELPLSDLHRSILNPFVNLYCGIRIMADSIVTNVDKNTGKRKVVYNGYWSTLGAGWHMHNRAAQIQESFPKLPFCGGHAIIQPQDVLFGTINTIQKAIKRAREHH